MVISVLTLILLTTTIVVVCSSAYRFHSRIRVKSVTDIKELAGIADPLKKIAIKSYGDHSDYGIVKMLILNDTYFVILLQCNNMTM